MRRNAKTPPSPTPCGKGGVRHTRLTSLRRNLAADSAPPDVIRTRGRVWVATQPDHALLLESAGGGLRVTQDGPWLAAMTPEQLAATSTERQALAALRWDERFGDRDTSMVILIHDADPDAIRTTLQWALLTDAELSEPHLWANWPDPFGNHHEDPCEPTAQVEQETSLLEGERR